MRLKQAFVLATTAAVLSCSLLPVDQPAWANSQKPLSGTIIHTEDKSTYPTVNPDEVKKVEVGTELDLVVSSSLSTGVTLEGDEFFAKLSKDVVVDGKIVIPKGSIVHGTVEQMTGPKRAGRDAYITTRFDYLITPDGREIPIDGDYSNRDNKLKAAAKVVGQAAGFTLGGGVVGALMVVKYGGLAAVAASNGYALAGGAAVGGAVGLTAAMVKKGHNAMIQPGAEIRIKLEETLLLPTMNMPDVTANDYSLDGLKVQVLGMRLDKDPFGEPNEVNLTLDISNYTEYTFSTFEMALEDEFGNYFYPSPFGDSGMWFGKITPNSKKRGNITFNVDNPKLQHKLVFFKQYTREPLAKYALTDEMLSRKASK